MSRVADILRRHAAAATVATPAIVAVHAIGVAGRRDVPLEGTDVTAGPYPLLRLLAAFESGMPVIGSLQVGALCLLLCAAAGFLMAAWRITRNRIVATAATVIFAAHPAAVAATHDPAGVRDVALALVLAWALALAARPRGRSPRFPNRPPTPAPPRLAVVLLTAPLVAPLGWLAAPFCFVFDLVHGAREGRSRRDVWLPGYAVHGVAVVLGVGLSMLYAPSPDVVERLANGTASTFTSGLAGVLTVRHADDLPLVLRLAVWAMTLFGLGLAALDVTTGIGRRRTLIPHLAFCGATSVLAAAGPLVTGEVGVRPAAAVSAAGLALLLGALFWRVAHVLEPDHDEAPSAVGPSWSVLRNQVVLEPLPPLPEPLEPAATDEAAPKTRLERLEGLVASLRQPMASADRDRDAIDAFVRSFAAERHHVLAVSLPGSPWASALASGAAGISFAVAPMRDGARNELEGAPGVMAFPRDELPWPVADGAVDALLAVDAFDDLEAEALAPYLRELLRALKAGGHGLVACPGALATDVMQALLEEIGFRVDVSTNAAPGDRVVLRVRRPRA